jgi:hypothetical protein
MRLLLTGICDRPGIPTSDVTVSSGASIANSRGHSHNVDDSQLRWEEFKCHVAVCRAANPTHVEHLWMNFSEHELSNFPQSEVRPTSDIPDVSELALLLP